MDKRKRTKGQTTIYKTLDIIELKIMFVNYSSLLKPMRTSLMHSFPNLTILCKPFGLFAPKAY
jgi:hypothetical protein